jgi:hypothetical protein
MGSFFYKRLTLVMLLKKSGLRNLGKKLNFLYAWEIHAFCNHRSKDEKLNPCFHFYNENDEVNQLKLFDKLETSLSKFDDLNKNK